GDKQAENDATSQKDKKKKKGAVQAVKLEDTTKMEYEEILAKAILISQNNCKYSRFSLNAAPLA
ncbi:570_t:CDS:1, partial [Cetraspora pellucida]